MASVRAGGVQERERGTLTKIERPAAKELALTERTAELRALIELEAERRQILQAYLAEHMIPSLHYYWLSENDREKGRKPSLSKDGALNLAGLYKCVIEPAEPVFEHFDGGHLDVRTRVALRAMDSGKVLAIGDGSCSTRESKYAFRWAWPTEAEALGIKEQAGVVTREVMARGRATKQYRVDNENPVDQHNTLVKMSFKRAAVAAVLQLPCVSELFTQDLEEQIEDARSRVVGAEEERVIVPPRAESLARVKAAAKALGLKMPAGLIEWVQTSGGLPKVKGAADITDEQMLRVAEALEANIAGARAADQDEFTDEGADRRDADAVTHLERVAVLAEKFHALGWDDEQVGIWVTEHGAVELLVQLALLDELIAQAAKVAADDPDDDDGAFEDFEDLRTRSEARLEGAREALGWTVDQLGGWVLKTIGQHVKFCTPEDLKRAADELEGVVLSRTGPGREAGTDG